MDDRIRDSADGFVWPISMGPGPLDIFPPGVSRFRLRFDSGFTGGFLYDHRARRPAQNCGHRHCNSRDHLRIALSLARIDWLDILVKSHLVRQMVAQPIRASSANGMVSRSTLRPMGNSK